MKKKIFAFDMDGTSLDSKSEFLPETLKAFKLIQESGSIVVFATGRSKNGVIPFALAANIKSYIVCNNGAYVYDFKNDRKELYEKLKHQIEALEDYKEENNGLDTIYLEREFLQSSRGIAQACDELSDFKNALFDQTEFGISAKELYLGMETDGGLVGSQGGYIKTPSVSGIAANDAGIQLGAELLTSNHTPTLGWLPSCRIYSTRVWCNA